MRLYESDPLLGIRFSRALSVAYAISGAEATLYAAPFSLPTTGSAPLLQWFLNGAPAQTGGVKARVARTGVPRQALLDQVDFFADRQF